jgi:hypothetical protein
MGSGTGIGGGVGVGVGMGGWLKLDSVISLQNSCRLFFNTSSSDASSSRCYISIKSKVYFGSVNY